MSGLIANRWKKEMEILTVLKNPSGCDKLINESHVMLILHLIPSFLFFSPFRTLAGWMALIQMCRFGTNALIRWKRSPPIYSENWINLCKWDLVSFLVEVEMFPPFFFFKNPPKQLLPCLKTTWNSCQKICSNPQLTSVYSPIALIATAQNICVKTGCRGSLHL